MVTNITLNIPGSHKVNDIDSTTDAASYVKNDSQFAIGERFSVPSRNQQVVTEPLHQLVPGNPTGLDIMPALPTAQRDSPAFLSPALAPSELGRRRSCATSANASRRASMAITISDVPEIQAVNVQKNTFLPVGERFSAPTHLKQSSVPSENSFKYAGSMISAVDQKESSALAPPTSTINDGGRRSSTASAITSRRSSMMIMVSDFPEIQEADVKKNTFLPVGERFNVPAVRLPVPSENTIKPAGSMVLLALPMKLEARRLSNVGRIPSILNINDMNDLNRSKSGSALNLSSKCGSTVSLAISKLKAAADEKTLTIPSLKSTPRCARVLDSRRGSFVATDLMMFKFSRPSNVDIYNPPPLRNIDVS